jgi:DNA repair protein RadA/Sms
MKNLLETALACFEVSPVVGVGANKAPRHAGWAQFFERQQTESEVRRQFSNGAWGIARVLYPACNYVVLDYDGAHAEEAWSKTKIVLPETARIRTQSGGHHLIFTASEFLRSSRIKRGVRFISADCECWKNDEPHPCGVDLLLNGIEVIPPSPGYVEEIPLALAVEIPDAVVKLARAKQQEERKNPKYTGKIPEGKRNVTLLSIGGTHRRAGMEYDELVKTLWKENRSRCRPPLEKAAVEKIAKSLCKYEPAEKPDEQKNVEFVSMDTIQPENIEWYWTDRVPKGYVTAIQGDPGVAKSYFTLKMAACASNGEPLPGNKERLSPCYVLLLAFEDAPSDIIRPRLDKLGADNSKIIIPDPKLGLAPNAMSAELIERAAKEVGPALVIIDPIVAFGGRRNNDKDSEVREFLQPLLHLAHAYGFACVVVKHLNKQSGPRALYRGGGSIDYAALFREIFTIAEDPNEEGRRVFAHTKNNISGIQPSLSFYIDESGFRWGDTVNLTADELVAPRTTKTRDRRQQAEAREFLKEALANGPMQSKKLFDKADVCHIAQRTLWRAKDELGIRARKERFGPWWWALPDDNSANNDGD